MSCQTANDYTFAGEMRNLDCTLETRPTWAAFRFALENLLDEGIPFETSVDPYYLPQPDYHILRTLDAHSGHAVVVTGYTDSSVVVNDPGVGIAFLGQPPIPNPEFRGADVVVDFETFRAAVELTMGSPRVLVSYVRVGPMPSRDVMLWRAVEKSIARLDGDESVYDDGLVYGWPPGWQPTFGRNAFETAGADMVQATFEARFWEMADETGGNLVATLNTLAAHFGDGMFRQQISWDASEAFYGTIGSPEAANLVALSAALSDEGESAWATYFQMLDAIYGAGGNPSVAEPYLAQVATDLDEIVVLEDAVRENLVDLLATGVADGTPGDEILRSAIVCAPNPFRGSTEVYFLRDGSSAGAVRVYDVAGRLVRELRPSDAAAGGESLTWSGHDAAGSNAAPGVYFVRDSRGYTTKVVKLE